MSLLLSLFTLAHGILSSRFVKEVEEMKEVKEMASSFHWLSITLVCVLALEKSEWRIGTGQAVASVPPQLVGCC